MIRIIFLTFFLFISSSSICQTWDELRKEYQENLKNAHYTEALEFAKEAKNIALKEFGRESKNFATALNDLGLILKYFGKHNEAKPLYEEALSIKESLYGTTHPNYATALNNLAGLLVEMDNFDEAEKMYVKSIEIYKSTLGVEHFNYINSRFSLGLLHHKTGNYSKAEKLYRETLPQKKEILGSEHPDYINSISNLAVLLKTMGNYEESEKLYLELLEKKKAVFGQGHPYYVASITNLASLYIELEEYDKAEPLYLEALAIQEQTIGKNHPDYSLTLNNLAALYNNRQEYEKAEQLFKEALQLRQDLLGKDSPKYAKSLDDLANLHFSKNQFTEAEALLLEAFKIRQVKLGSNHPEFAISNRNLALLYLEQNKYAEAQKYFTTLSKIRFSQIRNNFQFLSEVEKEKYWNTFKEEFDIFNTFAVKYYYTNPSLSAEIYNNHLVTKGILFSSNIKVRESILKSNNSQLINNYKEWMHLKQKYTKISLLPPEEYETNGTNLDSLENKINNLEKFLSEKSNVFAEDMKEKKIEWLDIKNSLNNNEAAVEFIAFNFYQDKHFTDDNFYIALVVKNNSEYPELIEIGTENELLKFFESNLSNSNTCDYILADSIASQLYEAVWKPILSSIKDKEKIYISLSGLLNKLAITMLPANNGKRIIDDYHLHILNSTRNIAIKHKKQKVNKKDIAIYGGVLYDIDLSVIKRNASYYNKNINTDETSLLSFVKEKKSRVQTWYYLEGTLNEVIGLSKILSQDNWQIDSLLKDKANEESFKKLSGNSPNVIHLATHGFFFPDIEVLRPIQFFSSNSNFKKAAANPMHRSGLIMAGANYIWKGNPAIEGVEDGILTSYEVANTDLSNTELVVMSACETGLGDIKTGEGVYGLQRAFQLAGVESVIMSLWTVPDKETVELMNNFYKNWIEGKDKYKAFREAQIQMSKKYEPYFWAGFVMVE